jgi:hypothetical protein
MGQRIRCPIFLFSLEHDLFGKPASTFPDHAAMRLFCFKPVSAG